MKSEWIKGMSAGLLAVAVLAGCTATTTPRLDEKFGEAANMAKAQQVINPDASQNRNPVTGIDGQAANSSIDNYHKAYETPAAAPSGGIGIMNVGTTLK
ncbi:hypothetical protein FGKAn22_14700 [Ferrigenium kumadai]|uniref:Lipoprotein n=1 Tax=Ferrigenium kumadai TaxID=1682490 RepID=A0AAN1SZ77_9PROT|nr:hypothetical protein [Ferrigenium kumadai]BBI99777.1 hypothetical protein FGKAn22_14700 [Ferrigenium kumadai]